MNNLPIPKGYELDLQASTPTNIILRKIQSWKDKLVQPSKDYHYVLYNDSEECFYVSDNPPGSRKPEHAFREYTHAELLKEKIILMQEMHAFAHVMNQGWETYWKNEANKYGIVMCKGRTYVDIWSCHNYFCFGIAVKSEQIAKQMLEEFGERIEKYYNQQY